MIVVARDRTLTVDEYIAVVGDSTLGSNRPIGDRDRIAQMIEQANLIVTARVDGVCVGLARCLTDFAWVCYCADLAVRHSHQRRGIGTQILTVCKELVGDGVGIVLLSAPEAVPYYNRLAATLKLQPTPNAYFLPRSRGV